MESPNDKALEVQVKVRIFDPITRTFSDVIAATANLAKPDKGLREGKEEWIMISIDPGSSPNYADARVLVSTYPKRNGPAPNAN